MGRAIRAADVAGLSIGELKRALQSVGVDFRDAVEKGDLVARLRAALRGGRSVDLPDAADALTDAERRNIQLFERCAPSVAFIHTSRGRGGGPLELDATEVPAGSGSGFVWDARGHVVTNYHVIHGARSARVTINRGQAYEATLVGAEPDYDLAVLRVAAPAAALQPIQVGSSAELQVGRFVAAIGNPFGLDHTYTTGVVSALGRSVQSPQAGRKLRGCVQTDAAINPGNSGGPLLDSHGRLVGVTVAIASPSGASAGIGFAIPVDTVRRVVNQLITHGRVRRPTIGVSVADDQVTAQLARRLGHALDGVLVMGVARGGAAHRAGVRGTERGAHGEIMLGDVITAVGTERVRGMEELLEAVEARGVGDSVTLTLSTVGAAGARRSRQARVVLQDRGAAGSRL